MSRRIMSLIGSVFLMTALLTPVYAAEKQVSASINNLRRQTPVLTLKPENTILQIGLQVSSSAALTIEKIKINLQGTTDLSDIESIKLSYIGNSLKSNVNRQFGKVFSPADNIVFKDRLVIHDQTAYFCVLVHLKKGIDLLHRINACCEYIDTDAGIVKSEEKTSERGLRVGVALRQHGDDQVDTYRIPGLTTTMNGTLLATYDVRRQKGGDLQGDIDIGLSRSTDGGTSWEPMRIGLDRGNWGGLPQKYNGISDACVLVNEKNNDIFIAGLWMHGILDKNGKWVEGLNENSTEWEHQWRGKGSQPGFDEKQTCQFLITKSTDDGRSWSEPVSLTRMCKKEEWWLLAPAPGHGITLSDGTLVFPTQGRGATGGSFSNITWSKDGGKTWKTSNAASTGTTENMVAQLQDGSIMSNMRDGKNKTNTSDSNGRVIAVSSDLGNTWTTHPTSRGGLIEPGCMASLHKHSYTEKGVKKSILLFSNPNSKSGRHHMTIKVSFDEGASWPEKNWILLDEGSSRGYSCLTSVDEQTIGILYEGSQSDMVFQKIALSDIINP